MELYVLAKEPIVKEVLEPEHIVVLEDVAPGMGAPVLVSLSRTTYCVEQPLLMMVNLTKVTGTALPGLIAMDALVAVEDGVIVVLEPTAVAEEKGV